VWQHGQVSGANENKLAVRLDVLRRRQMSFRRRKRTALQAGVTSEAGRSDFRVAAMRNPVSADVCGHTTTTWRKGFHFRCCRIWRTWRRLRLSVNMTYPPVLKISILRAFCIKVHTVLTHGKETFRKEISTSSCFASATGDVPQRGTD
jgi:hypothetical protein